MLSKATFKLLKPFQRTLLVLVLPVPLMLFGFLSSCASISQYQTARTLDPGSYEVQVGTGFYRSPHEGQEVTSNTNDDDEIIESYPDFSGRLGLLKGLDAGLKLHGNGFGADSKYMITDGKKWFALAPGLWYSQYTPWSRQKSTDINLYDIGINFHGSLHLGDYFAAYSSPGYFMRFIKGSTEGSTHMLYGNLGFKVGLEYGAYVELSTIKSLSTGYQAKQYSIAFFFAKKR